MKYLICYGNPVDGFIFIGPFEDQESAVEYMETEREKSDMWIAPIYNPENYK